MSPLSPKERRLKYGKTLDHVAMIEDPGAWAVEGILPLKSSAGLDADEFPRLGVLVIEGYSPFVAGESPYTVYETTLHEADFENCHRHRFASAQEIVDAGWEVD